MSKMYPDPNAPPAGFAPPPPYSSVPLQHAYDGIPHQPPPAQSTVIIVQNTSFGSEPQRMNCPHCHADIVTRTESAPTATTHLVFLICCLFICWPCAPFVYCTDCCLAKKHYCPRCNHYLGQGQ
ncbi:lipopolysaccharide-induced tumor necrosis factor-alpha factor homolog [Copidosoma floridanum]|uniref:lipopolysaccharide-induced tumor necrosis factor-alpha factor homolog n=1 Tax=Copidosoma floridanum TaxID=29053 RepID=UPI0006C9CA71|nr:lipopolysaccharide-induced tumor necrosis factor-alpha factor homolog [Copidosoma floridanum]XP_014206755.1 lipopolysaccharide-induced tumor necrosis factor-alpha factor homolog [Copidosoma floridanum]XP_023248545.1 lipopolysaccharide-induced tumor necrosis factor-alpha factor homolog [Copidosoma floridanum]